MKKVVLFIFFILIAWIYINSRHYTFRQLKFSSKKWQNYDISKCERKKMLYDLNRNYLRTGMSRAQVHKILKKTGNPYKTDVYNYEGYTLCGGKGEKELQREGFRGELLIHYKKNQVVKIEYCQDDFCDFKTVFHQLNAQEE